MATSASHYENPVVINPFSLGNEIWIKQRQDYGDRIAKGKKVVSLSKLFSNFPSHRDLPFLFKDTPADTIIKLMICAIVVH